MVSQQASSRFLKTATEGELMTKSGNLFHGSTIRAEKAACRRAKNDDATKGQDHEGENKMVEWRIYPAEGHICRGKLYTRELDQPAVFIFQGNIS